MHRSSASARRVAWAALAAALGAPVLFAGSHGPEGFGTPRAVQHGIPLAVEAFELELRAAWTTYDAFSRAELEDTLNSAVSLDYSLLSTATLRYGVADTLTMSATLAYWWTDGYTVGRETIDGTVSEGDPMGPSDLWLEGSWRFLRNPRGDFAFLFGVKLPFGSDDKRLDDGRAISPADQASTGAVDFRGGFALTNQLTERLRFDASVERLLHGDNGGFQQGDRWDVGAAMHWKLRQDVSTKAAWTLSGSLLMTNAEADDQNGSGGANTGGTVAWFAPALTRVGHDGTTWRVEVALPVSQQLDGDQVEADSRVTLGWTTGF
jgi:hypothetical protein